MINLSVRSSVVPEKRQHDDGLMCSALYDGVYRSAGIVVLPWEETWGCGAGARICTGIPDALRIAVRRSLNMCSRDPGTQGSVHAQTPSVSVHQLAFTGLVGVRLVGAQVDVCATGFAIEISIGSVCSQPFTDRRRSRFQMVVATAAGNILNKLRIGANDTSLGCAARACQVEVSTICVHQVVGHTVANVFRCDRTLDATRVGVNDVVIDFDVSGRAAVIVGFLATTKTYTVARVAEHRVVDDQKVVIIVAHVDTLASGKYHVVHDIARRRMVDTLNVAAAAANVVHLVTNDVVVGVGLASTLIGNDAATTAVIATRRVCDVVDPAVRDRRVAPVQADADADAGAAGAIELESVEVSVAASYRPHRVSPSHRHQDRAVFDIRNEANPRRCSTVHG